MIKNQIKTAMLLALLTALLLGIGTLIAGQTGLIIAFVFAMLMNFGSYWFSDKIVLWMYKAKEIKEKDNPRLYRLVREVAKAAGLPMPKICIIPSKASNAFATGRNYEHAAVACTEGILNLMEDNELKGVIAHEMSHIKNRDTLIQAITGTIAGVISYLASMAQWAAIFGGFGGRDDNDNGGLITLLVMAILAPILAMIIQLAISRSREYLADESAARMLKNGSGLASALKKLESDAAKHPIGFGNESTAHLFITNPFRGRGLMAMLSTHPATEERIKRLNSLKF
jgi:heat shock protein HtpX